MEWQATDQFGNLYIGESGAQSAEELRPHLEMLVEELHRRAGDVFTITVDHGYGEVGGPDPNQVSHIVQAPWLSAQPRDEAVALVSSCLRSICDKAGLAGVTIGAS